MSRKYKYLLIIFFSTFFALVIGFIGSYYWIKHVYLQEEIAANENAVKLNDWYQQDLFNPPEDGRITNKQILAFIEVNKDLVYLLTRMRQQFEENNWLIAIDVIKLQPEWLAQKYLALKKCNMSPVEYDWIVDQVVRFWIYRWKEESLEKFKSYGWRFDNIDYNEELLPPNYELLLTYDSDLSQIFNLLWPEDTSHKILKSDSIAN